MTRRRALRRAGLVAGVACWVAAAASVAAVGPAAAGDAPGSGFLSFGLTATAPGAQLTYDYPGATPSPQAEGEVPQSIAQLQSGPQAYALSSVAWPGPLAANGGSTSQLLNLGIPPSVADNLNDPVRAEARSGTGAPTVTNDDYPGTELAATATDDEASAHATMAGANGPAPKSGSGNTETSSSTKLTGPATAEARANSVVHDVALAGGVVRIKSVTSIATARTDGATTTATARTVVSGLEIGGQPAYVDDTGVHLGQGGPSAPVNEVASAIAQQALVGAGMKIAVSKPSIHVEGGRGLADAGNLVFYWAPPGDSHSDTFTATFGGASVSVDASPGSGAVAGGDAAPVSPAGDAATVGAPPAVGGDGVTPASGAGGAGGAPRPAAPAGTPGAPVAVLTPAGASHPLPGGLPPALPVLAVLGSVLVAGTLRRLPDRAVERADAACPLGGHP